MWAMHEMNLERYLNAEEYQPRQSEKSQDQDIMMRVLQKLPWEYMPYIEAPTLRNTARQSIPVRHLRGWKESLLETRYQCPRIIDPTENPINKEDVIELNKNPARKESE